MLGLTTLNDVLGKIEARGADKVVMLRQDGAEWKPVTAAELGARVRAVAAGLAAWGVGKGDRVAIVSENRWEWQVVDFAVTALGAVGVPVYPTLPADQVGYVLRDSGAKVVVVSSQEQWEKVKSAGELPAVKRVAVMDAGTFAGSESFATLAESAGGAEWFAGRMRAVKPEDLATIIYTSGTTGEPKGVMLTHGNLASNVNLAIPQFHLGEGDVCISYLPLSHVFERHVDYALLAAGCTVAYCARFETLPAAMKAVRPTFFVGVPRVYEKVRQGVEGKSTGVKKKILSWAMGVGKRHRREILVGRTPNGLGYRLAHKLVFGKIQAAFGGRVRAMVSGSAALGDDTCGWFADAGMRIFEGYGLTETSPVVSFNNPQANKMGTIGRALENMQVRLAADGEIEVKGSAVFGGYWNKPKETLEVFTDDGWFQTGDIGAIDSDGFLSITDRKKEIMKTSGGKMIAPQPIENKLKAHALVGQAAMVGNNHKFAAVLLSPNFAALESWAKSQGIATGDRRALVKDAKVMVEYRKIVDQVNGTLAHFEDMKRFAVVPDEWTVDEGELTPSMKLKRRVVEKKYQAQIAEMYKDEATASAR